MDLSAHATHVSQLKVAVIVRPQDGCFQAMTIGSRPGVSLYRLTGCILRSVAHSVSMPVIRSLTGMPEDVFVFVNVPLETTNHLCLDALTARALDPASGVVCPCLLDPQQQFINDPSERMFAVRRQRLAQAGGLATISGTRVPQLFARLIGDAAADGLTVEVHPDALAVMAASVRPRKIAGI